MPPGQPQNDAVHRPVTIILVLERPRGAAWIVEVADEVLVVSAFGTGGSTGACGAEDTGRS